jgi:hypothetical protein
VGAGAAGADLITTIASMPACGTAQNTITLAAAASVPVINALVYTSVPGVSATQTMGNCAIGADNSDGDTTHWASGWTGGMIPSYPSIRNVNINSTSGNAANNTCGIFFQGIWQPYGIHAETVNVQRLQYGVVQACPDIAPQSGICGEDQQWWIHVLVNATYPWISYGGGYNHLAGWQLSSNSTGAGPFILEVGISNGSAVTWDIHVPEWELASIGWIVRGTGHNLHGSQIVAAGTRSYFDTSSATCDPCYARATYPTGSGLTINGYGNTFSFKNSTAGLLGLRSSGRADIDGLLGTGVLQDNGVNNTITVNQLDSPGLGGQPGQTTAVNISRDLGFALSRSAEFAVGNAATPYYNRQDLLFFPKDYMFNPAQPIVADSNSYSGFYVARTVNDATRGFTTFKADPLQAVGNGQARICNIPAGCQVPASVVTVYESAKCPVQTSYTFNVQANLGSTVASATFPCTTTYTTNSIVVDLSTQNGKNLGFSWSGVTNEVDDAWIAVVPYSVSSTGAPNTVPKTKPGSSTLDPSWIPGVGNAMQRVAQVAPTLDTTGANINNIILYTTPAAGNYMLCGYLDMVVAASAGTYSMSGNYVSDGHTFAVIITASVGPAQWSVSSGVSPTTGSPCQNFYADAGTNITAKITATGITGSPTLRYVASLWQL